MAKKPAYIDTQNFGSDDLFFVDKVTMTRAFPVHRHSFAELQYFESGYGEEIINGITYPIQPGSFSLKLPWHVHELKPAPGEVLQIYKCSFRMQTLEEGGFLQSVSSILAENYDFEPMEQLHEKEAQKVRHIFMCMKEEGSAFRMMQDEMLAAQIVQLLVCFIRNMKLTGEGISSEQSRKRIVQRVVQMLNLRYREDDLSCKKIAQAVNYSEVQVARLLKEEMGLSFGELLREIRVRNACSLLRNTDYPAEKIGMWVGYRSRTGFYSAFSGQMGITPVEYRKKYSSKEDAEPIKILSSSRVYTQIIYYMHKHYMEPLDLERTAQEFHYSSAYLERLLAENGTSFTELLRDIRIYHARQLLLWSDAPIPIIAEQTGFSSPETFFRVFKKQTGYSPDAYRRHVLNMESP